MSTGSASTVPAVPAVPAVASARAIADELVAACRDAGTTHVFGVPGGGSNLDVVGAAVAQGLDFVLVHTETAATIMAGVMGTLTGAPGLAVATRGPGAASAVNGVAQALLDRQPMVLVTDCVAARDRQRVSHQRLAQQALMATVAKASLVLDGSDPDASAYVVELAVSGRPGPVHVDIDITAGTAGTAGSSDRSDACPNRSGAGPTTPPGGSIDMAGRPAARAHELVDVLELVAAARRPVIVVGVGAVVQMPSVRDATAAALADVGARHDVPVLCTYAARGMVPDDVPWCAGVATGATIESPVLSAADLVIGIGLDPVELIPGSWSYESPVVLLGTWVVDDSEYFGDRLVAEVVVDLPAALGFLERTAVSTWSPGAGAAFAQRAIAEIRAARPASVHATAIVPQDVVDRAAAIAPAGTIATVDAGAHMLVAMPLWPVAAPCELLISSGLATMGFALPAAIAAALAHPRRRVVCFTGDGGLGMALAELETVARRRLPIAIVVFDDASLSLIAAKQRPDGHGGDLAVRYAPIDFAAVAAACGVASVRVEGPDALEAYDEALRRAMTSEGPMLIDVAVDPSAYGTVLDAIRGARPADPAALATPAARGATEV